MPSKRLRLRFVVAHSLGAMLFKLTLNQVANSLAFPLLVSDFIVQGPNPQGDGKLVRPSRTFFILFVGVVCFRFLLRFSQCGLFFPLCISALPPTSLFPLSQTIYRINHCRVSAAILFASLSLCVCVCEFCCDGLRRSTLLEFALGPASAHRTPSELHS